MTATDIIRRLQPELEKVNGVTFYMQPVQDLTVEDRVSRTQYQYSLESADAHELWAGPPNWWRSCADCLDGTWPMISKMADSASIGHRS